MNIQEKYCSFQDFQKNESIDQPIPFNIEIITDLTECIRMWQSFPTTHFSDLIDVRKVWREVDKGDPYFITAISKNGEILGFLPLEYYPKYNKYWFFGGGWWMEWVKAIVRPDARFIIPFLYAQLPSNAFLTWIAHDLEVINQMKYVADDFFLDLSNINWDFDKFLQRIENPHRKHIRQDLKKIEALNPRVTLNEFQNIPLMIELNKKRFETDSTMQERSVRQFIEFIVQKPALLPYIRFQSVYIENQFKIGVLCFAWGEEYIYYQGGNDTDIPNLGKFANLVAIMDAMKLKSKIMYFGGDDCHWKNRWGLDKRPLYEWIGRNILQKELKNLIH